MPDKLTPKQAAFCDEYSIDLNGRQAAIRAGYALKGAQQRSAVLLSYDNVQKRVSKLLAERAERRQITADNILKALWDNHKLALARGDLGISNRALELCGKANRLFIDRVEQVTVYEAMSDDELDAAISQAEKDIEQVQRH